MVDSKRTKIKFALTGKVDENVRVSGWVRTKRASSNVAFIALNDGSTINNLQIVADVAKFEETLTTNLSLRA